jgi:hypothetical protein
LSNWNDSEHCSIRATISSSLCRFRPVTLPTSMNLPADSWTFPVSRPRNVRGDLVPGSVSRRWLLYLYGKDRTDVDVGGVTIVSLSWRWQLPVRCPCGWCLQGGLCCTRCLITERKLAEEERQAHYGSLKLDR